MTIDLATIHLGNGSHTTRAEGVCLLEAVAWFAGEPHTDQPACVSPVLGSFGRHLNDVLPDEKRQLLTAFVTQMPGTADDALDEKRGYLALDWLVRMYTPAWMEAAGLVDAAVYLRGLPQVMDLYSAEAAGGKVRRACEEARSAWAAAWAAAGAAARAAAWDAARAAARAAAGAAAWDAAGDAAWDALAPTIATLQDSAIELFKNMINPS